MRRGLRWLLLACLVGLGSAGVAWAAPPATDFTSQAGGDSKRPSPLQVLEVDPATFVVVRRRGDGHGVEGFVIDRDALLQSLRTRVLEDQGLGALARVTTAEPGPGDGVASKGERYGDFPSQYAFEHDFAAPFTKLKARLDLAPLADSKAPGELLAPLALGLGVAIIIGLFALYRMVAVQVAFAQRRSNFVSAVSHELKTPLTAIRMYGEMLRDGLVENDDKRQEYYGTISAETERLSRLINNVLELSRLERHERTMELRVGNLAEVTREALDLFRPHATAEGFALELVEAPGLPAARFDRDAVMQVLFNLLDNALKYGRGGNERLIEVICEPIDDRVQLRVRDHGPGVQAGQLRAIFEPFYRAQDELTRKQKGTGIGLSLVRGLVERMHGQVEGHNLPEGFEVRVTLPAAQ